MKNKNGFTLSEILITIGIIGVISALTLPNMTNQLKKSTYSGTLSKAIDQIKLGCVNMMQSDFTETGSVSYADTLTSMTSRTFDGSLQEYTDSTVAAYAAGADTSIKTFSGGAYAAPDGTRYRFRKFDADFLVAPVTAAEAAEGNFRTLYIDADRFDKGPNRLGKDVFKFYLREDGKIQPAGNASLCTRANVASRSGEDCSARVLADGFVIRYY